MPFFQIRVTTEQRASLQDAAEAQGVSATEYVRSLVPELGGVPPSSPVMKGTVAAPQRPGGSSSSPRSDPEASDRAEPLGNPAKGYGEPIPCDDPRRKPLVAKFSRQMSTSAAEREADRVLASL